MRKHMSFLVGIIFFLCLFATNSCKTAIDPLEDPPDESLERFKELADFANWPGKYGPIREGVDLKKYSISSLSDVPMKSKGNPFFYSEAENGIPALIHHSLHWEKSSGNALTIDLQIAESCEEIHEYVIQRFYNSSMPFELRIPKKDDPVIAGEISFSGGRRFIRNNIFVEIQAVGELRERISQVAKEIDNILLSKPTASSAKEFKPVIKRFEIANNLIEPLTRTQLFVEAYDPQGSELFYFWRLSAGSIGKDDFGQLYYFSSEDAAPGTTQTITLIVINGRGYFQKSSLEVRIKQN